MMLVWWAACRPEAQTQLAASCETTDNAVRVRCEVTVDPAQAVTLRYAERELQSEQALSEHVFELALLQPDADYLFVANAGEAELEGHFRTDALPLQLQSELAVTGQSSVPFLGADLPCDDAAYAVIYDTTTGQIVWYELLDEQGQLGPMDMVHFTEDHTVLGETHGRIVEVDLQGRVLLELQQGVDFDRELHHDIFKRDGRVYVLYMMQGDPMLDGFYVFDAVTGERLADWDASESLDIPAGASGDWMHTNAIWVDEAGQIYLSLLTQNSILQLEGDLASPTFGTQRWALAGALPAGLGMDFALDWGALGEASFRDQHAVRRLPDGRLLMLDNAHHRALLWSLDDEALTATALGEYPAGEMACGPQGTAAMTASGHVMVGCSMGSLLEYTPQGEVTWTGAVRGCVDRPMAARFYPLEGW